MGGGGSTPSGENPSNVERDAGGSVAQSGNATSSSGSSTSSSGGSSSNVTSGDVAEIEAHSDSLSDVIDTSSPTGSPTPGEFARQTFADGVQARRIEAGFDGHEATITDPDATMIGGWDAFDPGDITDRETLQQAVNTSGRTAEVMEEVTLSDASDRAATKAYVTNYDHDWNHPTHAPSLKNAHSQMASYAALDSMGVEVPRHAFNQDTKEVFVESVGRPGYDAEIAEIGELSSEYANRVDPDQMRDVMAANLIVGNGDLKADNLMVGEDGRVTTFDFDYTDTYGQLVAAESRNKNWLDNGINAINEARDDDLGLTPRDITDRAEELATQLDESGTVDRVVEAAEQYDEFFANENKSDYGMSTRSGISPMSHRVEKHVTNWSSASNDVVL